jgi:hypothetical protein
LTIGKVRPFLTDALLHEEDRAAVVQLDHAADEQPYGQGDQQDARRADDVDGALGEGVETADRRPLDVQQGHAGRRAQGQAGAATSLMPGWTKRSTPISDNAQPRRRRALPGEGGVGGDDDGFGAGVTHGEQGGLGATVERHVGDPGGIREVGGAGADDPHPGRHDGRS